MIKIRYTKIIFEIEDKEYVLFCEKRLFRRKYHLFRKIEDKTVLKEMPIKCIENSTLQKAIHYSYLKIKKIIGEKKECNKEKHMVSLTDKDLHCMSRLIQSSMFAEGENIFYGCRYCKYGLECKECIQKRQALYDIKLRKKLQKLTGVDLSPYQPEELEKKFYPASFQALYPKDYEQLLQEQDKCQCNEDNL